MPLSSTGDGMGIISEKTKGTVSKLGYPNGVYLPSFVFPAN